MAIGGYNRTHVHGRLRRSRMSLPRVNNDPRPPNERKALGAGIPSPYGKLPGTSNPIDNRSQNQVNDKTPTNNPLSRELEGFSTYQPQQGVPDPRDDRYWADLAKSLYNKNQGLSQLNTESVFARTAYDTNLEDLARQQPRDEQNLYENANRAGAFYSTATSEAVGRLGQQYERQRSELGSQFNQENALRDIARSALEQGYTVEEAGLLAEAVHRQSEGELNRPAPPGDNEVPYGQQPGKQARVNRQVKILQRKLRTATGSDRTRIRKRLRRLNG